MQAILFGSVEMQMLWWSVVLGLVHLLLTAGLANRDRGLSYNFSARDQTAPPVGAVTARMARAFRNFLETFPFFAVAILMVFFLKRSSPMSELGAQIYFWARLAYVPTYAAGIPYLRSAIWGVSFAGLVMVLASVWPGV